MTLHLKWSRAQTGTWNGKIGEITLFAVAWYAKRGWFVAPKLPGLRTIDVESMEAGKRLAEKLWGEWYREVGLERGKNV